MTLQHGRILTTRTGSLPRPDDLIQMMWAREDGDPQDPGALEDRSVAAVDEAVRRQASAGVDIVNDGEQGEITVRGVPGRSLMPGYFKNPRATAETLRDGWLYSGDNAVRDADGFYRFVDRKKDMIKRSGENVSAGEVENVVLQHPAVFECAVIGLPDELCFFLGLMFIVIGTGLLKPNVSTMVGDLYPEGGARRDAGFSIFYMGINLGAFIGPILTGILGEDYNWHWGFSLAGIGMVLGLIQYKMGEKYFGDAGGLKPESIETRSDANRVVLTGIAVVVAVLVGTAGLILMANQIDNNMNSAADRMAETADNN